MKRHHLSLVFIFLVLISCRTNKPQPKEEPRMLVTSELLKGHKFGYSSEAPDVTYYHFLEFDTDSTAVMLMGGDVLEACSYYTKADSVYVTVIHTDPPYTEIFGYKDGKLIDRRGNIWDLQNR